MSATLLLLLAVPIAQPGGVPDWTFSRKTTTVEQRSTVTPAPRPLLAVPVPVPVLIGEGRIPPVGFATPVGVSSCGNPLCPCGVCDCQNCRCGLPRPVAAPVSLPPVQYVPVPIRAVSPPPVYYAPPTPAPASYAPPVYYQQSATFQYSVPAPARQAAPVRQQAQWTWPGGTEASLRQHLYRTHGAAVNGLSYAQLVALHDSLHNGRRASAQPIYQQPRYSSGRAACPT